MPVCLPSSDHSVSPCRTMKHRGVVIMTGRMTWKLSGSKDSGVGEDECLGRRKSLHERHDQISEMGDK